MVNANKCLFGQHIIEYLGHLVSGDGVQMDPNKISSVLQWSASTNGVRGLQGLTKYYC